MWYGENRSRRTKRWNAGDLLRYDYGPTALMRVTAVREMGDDPRGIACSVRYYGRAFHSTGTCTGRYHGQCLDPTEHDRGVWALAHDDNDEWIPGMWGAASAIEARSDATGTGAAEGESATAESGDAQ